MVTGTRVFIPGLKAISPVTSIGAKAIANTGLTSVEDVLNQLPQVTADQGAMASNGASGTATINLRDLDPNRTLLLIDGRRLMRGDPATGSNAADINNIPTAVVERVDVLSGGASSVYGADAAAGAMRGTRRHGRAVRHDRRAGQSGRAAQRPAGRQPAPQAEEADTHTFGVVYNPTYLPGLSATLGYHDIKINGVISRYGEDHPVLATTSLPPICCTFATSSPRTAQQPPIEAVAFSQRTGVFRRNALVISRPTQIRPWQQPG